jgi:outer membrane protein OmpA-like peptidoglycan-associated protein
MPFFVFGTVQSGFSQQNLVRNPSFENYTHLPQYIGDAPDAITDWHFANEGGSGDYYHKNAGFAYRVPDNHFGSENPHSGNAYAGFCVTPIYREFLASELTLRLEKGKKYKFTMYISNGDKEDVSYVKEISVLFLSRQWTLENDLQMGLPPQIVFYQDTGFTKSDGWQELTAIYTARGTEQWMYIGAHQWQCDTCASVPGTPRKASPWIFGGDKKVLQAHYYVDDVSIVEVTDGPKADTTELKTGIVYAFNNIHFATNSAVLEKVDQPDLEKILAYLLSHETVSVTVYGHTDSIGTTEDNYKLSVARADAVKKFLMDHGIQEGRISTVGHGETKPVAPNNTAAGRALNRRVEFLFEGTGDD